MNQMTSTPQTVLHHLIGKLTQKQHNTTTLSVQNDPRVGPGDRSIQSRSMKQCPLRGTGGVEFTWRQPTALEGTVFIAEGFAGCGS